MDEMNPQQYQEKFQNKIKDIYIFKLSGIKNKEKFKQYLVVYFVKITLCQLGNSSRHICNFIKGMYHIYLLSTSNFNIFKDLS
jgi:hypothetical protein